MVQNPVLFITFARPEYARRTWNAIKAAKPSKLYFYSNKGREEKEGEVEKNNQIRAFVNEIDWECDLHTWFRDECVDVYTSLHGAISWLFKNEEQGIVLEEDCVASLAFFDYCDKLLPKYKDDYRIWLISGDNYFEDNDFGEYDYFYSQDIQIYGWASWRSRWNQVDWKNGIDFDSIYSENTVSAIIRGINYPKFYLRRIKSNESFLRKTKCWDRTFHTFGILNNSLAIVPSRNLVENIGLQGTHSKNARRGMTNVKVTYKDPQMSTENHPHFIAPNLKYDSMIFDARYKKSYSLFYRIINKLASIIK